MANTPNLGLHQWAANDPFLRTDFNSDFSKIDLAVGGANRMVKLREVSLSTAAARLDVDVSGIDWSKYLRLEFYLSGGGSTTGQIGRVYFNNYSAYPRYRVMPTGNTSSTYTYAFIFQSGPRMAHMTLYCGAPVVCGEYKLMGDCFGSGTFYLEAASDVTMSTLSTVNFVGDSALPAGTKVLVYGIKK